MLVLTLGASALVMRSTPITMQTTAAPVLTADRYVATNRFRVKEGREAAFEKRWADRQSRLGLLDGFKFFCMMRRVERGEGKVYEDDINYISCTVWDQQANFDAWKAGDAFKEAHGGGTIGGIASMLVATARNTKGKPKAAMWEGLLPATMTPAAGTTPSSGWRQVQADGVDTLDGECFLAMNRFSVKEGSEESFEQKFAQRESTLEGRDGFKGFLLLRRDGADPDGFTHSTWSVWRDRAAFDGWMGSQKKPSGGVGGPPASGGPPAGGPPSIYVRPPVPSFYEGILMLESQGGI